MTNCVNCGAILKGNICEYCGTRYDNNSISVDFKPDDCFGELKVGNVCYKVYLGHVETTPIFSADTGRDENGNLHGTIIATKHKFVLIEV